jgi:hypothetical protein
MEPETKIYLRGETVGVPHELYSHILHCLKEERERKGIQKPSATFCVDTAG